ncbi:hypothetical protein LTR37_007095 [Vermiconidia calcicola]|uniref:Uncharacterized protein n=1 Tax=Vermiconidia calcicola TaxID=1690605 RepID=A0ACC3NFH9_9PEZI|nr:hypothetical protein LTR37_007095 [Vermiconidia calcicola]
MSRGGSLSPTDQTVTASSGSATPVNMPNGGVQPVGGPNGTSSTGGVSAPDWKGPEQDGGITVTDDPFEKSQKNGAQGPKLSGGAHKFQPDGSSKKAPIDFLNRDSEADDDGEKPMIVCSARKDSASQPDKGKGKAVQEPIGTRGVAFSPDRPRIHFTTDVGKDSKPPGGHYIKVENLLSKNVAQTLQIWFKEFDWDSKVCGCAAPPTDSNFITVFTAFDDIRDAEAALEDIQMFDTRLNCTYITQTEYAATKDSDYRGTIDHSTKFHDGQVVFIANFKGLTSEMNVQNLYDIIYHLAMKFGNLIGIVEIESEGGSFEFRAEYMKISSGKAALGEITKAKPANVGKWVISTRELPDHTVQAALKNDKAVTGTPQKIVSNGHVQFASPTGRTAWRVDENGNQVPARGPRQLPKAYAAPAGANTPVRYRQSDPAPQTPANYFAVSAGGPRSGSWTGGHYTPSTRDSESTSGPQVVDLERVMNGVDVRTTIMVRNIPNDLNSSEFKKLIDIPSRGKYDFAYLRIDFSKDANVGYGFINFITPEDMATFVEHYRGYPWCPSRPFNKRHGPRLAEISYATVQGIDCLVEKFRNSAIMDEYAGYRPKLFHTATTSPHPSMIGKERDFPPPNNESKHKRSSDNATTVGLYAPANRRGRVQYGDRHRRSQYDRGTTAQIQEDAFYQQMSPLQHGYNNQQAFMFQAMGPPPVFPPMTYMNGNAHFMNGGVVNPGFYPQHVNFTDPFQGGHAQHHQNGNHQNGQVVVYGDQAYAGYYDNDGNYHGGAPNNGYGYPYGQQQ